MKIRERVRSLKDKMAARRERKAVAEELRRSRASAKAIAEMCRQNGGAYFPHDGRLGQLRPGIPMDEFGGGDAWKRR